MKGMPYFSIITPCYNVEKYLKIAIDSVLRQNFYDWELLLIDDGSTDNTSFILDEYSLKDERIRVYHKCNGGVSSARNYGLNKSLGEWILFLDSDDWLTDDALFSFFSEINRSKSDIYCSNGFINKKDVEFKRKHITSITRIGKEKKWFVLDTIFPYIDFIYNNIYVGAIRGVNCKLYRRKVLLDNNIRFDETLKIAEDALFNYYSYSAANSITVFDKYLFHYRINQDSVMHKYNPNICSINDNVMISFYDLIKSEIDYDEKVKICFLGMASECIFRAMKLDFQNVSNPCSYRIRKKMLKNYLNTPIMQKALEYKDYSCIPLGKKLILWCIKHNFIGSCFFFSKLCMLYLYLKNEI